MAAKPPLPVPVLVLSADYAFCSTFRLHTKRFLIQLFYASPLQTMSGHIGSNPLYLASEHMVSSVSELGLELRSALFNIPVWIHLHCVLKPMTASLSSWVYRHGLRLRRSEQLCRCCGLGWNVGSEASPPPQASEPEPKQLYSSF